MRRLSVLAFALVAGTVSRRAVAANSNFSTSLTVDGAFFMVVVTQDPGVTWTFTSSNLSPGADTVIHVQNFDDPLGGFIAGGDDYNGTLASNVVVPPISTSRNLRVILRRYSQNSGGTCDLTGTPSSGEGFFYSQIALGGDMYSMNGPLTLGAYVTTAEAQGGATDTVLLVFNISDPSHAIAFDDDAGVGFMSRVHLPEACFSCWAAIANFSSFTPSVNTNLYWDDDLDTTDYDGDGVGATLEGVICEGSACLDPNVADTDQDGLNDGAEIYGLENQDIPVKLATWGADPLQKDIFYEMDWQTCVNTTDTTKCPQGADSGQMGAGFPSDSDFDANVFSPLQSDLAGVRVHLDAARAAASSDFWLNWGDWGGAESQANANQKGCGNEGFSSWRTSLFHHLVSFPPEDETPIGGALGRTCYGPGPFLTTGVNQWRVVSHESGHGLGLSHGGRPFTSDVNFKTNYISIMNYEYEFAAPSFATGIFPSLNPHSLSETTGLGPGAGSVDLINGKSLLQNLRDEWCPITAYSSGKCVQIDGNAGSTSTIPIGSVDWNRDGVYATSGTVQGPVQRTAFTGEAQSRFGTLKDGSMAWVNVGSPMGSYLFVFGRDPNGNLVWARQTGSALNAGCAGPFNPFVEGIGDCAGLGGATTQVPGPINAVVAPAAAEYDSNKILLVYQHATGAITAKLLTISSSGAVTYGTPTSVPGGWFAAGDITAINTGSGSTKQVTVWAPVRVNSVPKLMQFRYTNGGWESAVATQRWTEDSSDIVPDSATGIGATRGYQDNSPTPQIYAAIPSSNGLIEFARQNSGGPYWSRVTLTCPSSCGPGDIRCFGCSGGSASSWVGTGGAGLPPGGTQPRAFGRPGLAYQQKAGQPNVYVGRFYMAFNQPAGSCSGTFGSDPSNTGCAPMLIMTEGNIANGTPSSSRLTWIMPAQPMGAGAPFGVGGISLIDDSSRDVNLRAFMVDPYKVGQFMPLADGIINASMTDLNDSNYITGALRAALCLDGGRWPQGVLPPNLP